MMKSLSHEVYIEVCVCSVINYNPEPQICQISTLTKLQTPDQRSIDYFLKHSLHLSPSLCFNNLFE